MKASAKNLLSIIKEPKQFIIPIYQRTYSWQFKQCALLLKDIQEASKILISVYSFSDKHINQELQKRSDLEIINQNPSVNYPFEAKQISNIQRLNNLTV